MIKINLLPGHLKRKKKEPTIKIIIMLTILITYTFIGTSFLWIYKTEKNENERISQLKSELKRYRGLEKKIKELETEQNILKLKIKLITKLLKENPTAIKTIDLVVKNIPKEKIFLDSIKCNLTSVEIEGNSVSLDSIARYITNLEQTKKFKKISLEGTKTRKINENLFINFKLKIKK